jgi:redox-sensitive bicupin YhaK (pirin superfamily)
MFSMLYHVLLCSSSQHEDSAGHKGTIGKRTSFPSHFNFADFLEQVSGGVQWMCAGKGIIHAEMPIHVPGSPDPRGLQLWVDLPKQVHLKKWNMTEEDPNR